MKHDFLHKILPIKEREAEVLRAKRNVFLELFDDASRVIFIGEVKPKSPNMKSAVQTNFVQQAKLYAEGGVDAISVLTDETFFGGSIELLAQVRSTVAVPLLMKDFVLDEAQIIAGVNAGANTVLLIVDFLEKERLKRLARFCRQVGIEPLVEIQDEHELKIALRAGARIIGVNSRNLRTLEIDMARALRVVHVASQHVPTLFLSSIQQRSDVEAALEAGARGVLVGTTLMTSDNVGKTLRHLKGGQ
jgi:indole-3-glycerol phosphate synthase